MYSNALQIQFNWFNCLSENVLHIHFEFDYLLKQLCIFEKTFFSVVFAVFLDFSQILSFTILYSSPH